MALARIEIDLRDYLFELSVEELEELIREKTGRGRGVPEDLYRDFKEALSLLHRGQPKAAESCLERALHPVFRNEDEARARYEKAMRRAA